MKFAEFHAGQVIEAGPYLVTEEELLQFAKAYDPQWFHTDAKAAAEGPFGGLIACEDNASKGASPDNRLVYIARDGSCRLLARNALNESELAGACFSPDGTWLFVSIYSPGITLAVTGPWSG